MIFIANACASAHLLMEDNGHDDCLFLNLLPKTSGPVPLVHASPVSYLRLPDSEWCLLQDNFSAPGLDQAMLQWLTGYVVPALRVAGVRYWVWVCGPTLASYHLAQEVASQLPQLVINIFYDLEHATTWMQHQLAALLPSSPQRMHQPAGWTSTRPPLLPVSASFGHPIQHVA
jgi:hypothetical protein